MERAAEAGAAGGAGGGVGATAAGATGAEAGEVMAGDGGRLTAAAGAGAGAAGAGVVVAGVFATVGLVPSKPPLPGPKLRVAATWACGSRGGDCGT